MSKRWIILKTDEPKVLQGKVSSWWGWKWEPVWVIPMPGVPYQIFQDEEFARKIARTLGKNAQVCEVRNPILES